MRNRWLHLRAFANFVTRPRCAWRVWRPAPLADRPPVKPLNAIVWPSEMEVRAGGGGVGLAIAKRPRVANRRSGNFGDFLGDTTVKARFSRQTTACGVCPGALLHLGVMLLRCLQKSRVRGCASKQCAALPPPPQRRSREAAEKFFLLRSDLGL